jgi:N6-adenosine-specific RNA methylase IME4
MELKIDPEFKALLAPLSAEQYAGLEEDILDKGCLDTIKIWNDTIIDGHNRFSICMRHGVMFQTEELEFDSREDVIEWMIRNQLNRRNQTPEQISYFRGKLHEQEKKTQGRPRKPEIISGFVGEADTAKKLAEEYGVTSRTIYNDAIFAKAIDTIGEQVGEDVKHQILSGELPVTKKDVVKLAQMPEETRKAITEKIATGATMADAIREEKRAEVIARLEDVEAREAKELAGQYDVIVIDPPWPMEKIERDVRPNQTEFDYPTMSEEELADMILPAADECHLWLWTTHRFLPMAFRLLDAWEFKYVCTFVWHKPGGFQPIGLPQYNCEFALYARRGAPKFIDTKALPVCFEAPRGAHSEKPEAFYDVVRRVTAGRRIDIFNRRAIDGFDSWGKEAGE